MSHTFCPLARIYGLLVLALAGATACKPTGQVTLLNAETGAPLVDAHVDVFRHSGEHCIAAPCGSGENWAGRTDAEGRVTIPAGPTGWDNTLSVEGFRGARLETGKRSYRLKPRPPIKPRKKKKTAALGPPHAEPADLFALTSVAIGRPSVSVILRNRGDTAVTFVTPDPAKLTRYGQWGGWTLTVRAEGKTYAPMPLPGPYVAAHAGDIMVLAAGDVRQFTFEISGWVTGAAGNKQPLSAATGTLAAKLRWAGLPPHVKVPGANVAAAQTSTLDGLRIKPRPAAVPSAP